MLGSETRCTIVSLEKNYLVRFTFGDRSMELDGSMLGPLGNALAMPLSIQVFDGLDSDFQLF